MASLPGIEGLARSSSEKDAPLHRSEIELNPAIRCKGPEVQLAQLVPFAERILIDHRREQSSPLLERDPGPLARTSPIDRVGERSLAGGFELPSGRRLDGAASEERL